MEAGGGGGGFSDSEDSEEEDDKTKNDEVVRNPSGRLSEGELGELNLVWNLMSLCDGLGGICLGSSAKISLEVSGVATS